jgi:polyisoprenoid-binding protein YceI
MMNFRPALALLLLTLVSCRAPAPQTPQAPQSLPEFPVEAYRPTMGEDVYRIDSDHSRADIVVRRGGKLARFGHDHVVSATQMDGYILVAANDLNRSHADVRLALDSLILDDPLLREQFGLDTQPSAQDIENTSENMHGKVLQTEFWPQVHLQLKITGGTQEAPEAQLTLSLHGETHSFPITFKLEGIGMAQLQASGAFRLRQSDYGMEPLSILGGGLQVLDPVDVTFHLQANQVMQ